MKETMTYLILLGLWAIGCGFIGRHGFADNVSGAGLFLVAVAAFAAIVALAGLAADDRK